MTDIQIQTVEVCVFRVHGENREYLILQRSALDDLYPNIWQIVTGTLNPGESAVQAAVRELSEETHLTLRRFWTVPLVDAYYDAAKDIIQNVPVFAAEIDPESKLQLSAEHQHFAWLKRDEALARLVWPGQKKAIDMVDEFFGFHSEAARFMEITNLNLEGISS